MNSEEFVLYLFQKEYYYFAKELEHERVACKYHQSKIGAVLASGVWV